MPQIGFLWGIMGGVALLTVRFEGLNFNAKHTEASKNKYHINRRKDCRTCITVGTSLIKKKNPNTARFSLNSKEDIIWI